MPNINFPTSPALNDQYSFEGKTWTYNGVAWVIFSSPTSLRLDSAYQTANSASSYANGSFTVANTANQIAVTSGAYANSSYLHANAAFSAANNAFNASQPLSGEFDYGLITDVNNTIQDYGTL